MNTRARVVTLAIWQTLLDEAEEFSGAVTANRVLVVVDQARRAGVRPTASQAAEALDAAAARFEAAYLAGRPITNVERATLIAQAVGAPTDGGWPIDLATRLGATHDPRKLRVRPGVRRMLHGLAQDSILVGLSDTWMSPGSTLREAMAYHRLHRYFHSLRFSDETGVSKAGGGAWEATAASLGVEVGKVVHVGDLPSIDGVAALQAGCAAALLVAHPDHPVPDLDGDLGGAILLPSAEDVPKAVRLVRGDGATGVRNHSGRRGPGPTVPD